MKVKKGEPFHESASYGELGLVHLYTGHGKGKTTASLGLAIRAIGHGFSVYMIQFLKGGGYTGEVITVNNVLQAMEIKQFGKECVDEQKQTKLTGYNGNMVRSHENCGGCRYCFTIDEEEKLHAQRGFSLAKKIAASGDYDVVILDEVCGAINEGLVELDQVLELTKKKHKKTELLLTGRDAPSGLIKIADYVSHVEKVKHPFDKGIEARRGIEF
jgi:cob(I)alamin adenosyltransferase